MPEELRRRFGGKPALLLAAAVAVFLAHAAWFLPWQEDDAFISFRYARNIVDGHGAVFNPGEAVEGYSNPAWVAMAALVLKAGGDPLAAARWLGLAGGVAALLLAWRLAGIMIGDVRHPAALLAPWWLAVTPVLPRHAVTGLETAPYVAVLAAAVLFAGRRPGDRPGAAVPCLLLTLMLLRPEGIAFAGCALAWRLLAATGRPRRSAALEAAFTAVCVLLLLAWRWSAYGQLLPNTFHAKMTGGGAGLREGLAYALDFLAENGGPVLAGLALAPAFLGGRSGLYGVALGAAALQGALILAAGGDWMHFHRFGAPALPLLAAAAAAGAAALARAATATTCRRGLAGLATVVLLASLVGVVRTERAAARLVLPDVKAGRYLTDGYREAGAWIRANTPADATVAVSDIGIIGYESRRRIIDMFGLVDPRLARRPGRLHHRSDPDLVLAEAPDIVVLVAGPDGSHLRIPDAALAARPEFAARYALVHTVAVGFRDEQIRIYALR